MLLSKYKNMHVKLIFNNYNLSTFLAQSSVGVTPDYYNDNTTTKGPSGQWICNQLQDLTYLFGLWTVQLVPANFFSLLLHILKEQQMTPEDYDDAITAGWRHRATGLLLLIISTFKHDLYDF